MQYKSDSKHFDKQNVILGSADMCCMDRDTFHGTLHSRRTFADVCTDTL